MWLQWFFSESMQDITWLLISAFIITTVNNNTTTSQKWSRISCLAASVGVWVPLTANSVWPLYTVLQVRTELWRYSCSGGLLFLAWARRSLYFLVTFTCLPVFHVCFFVGLQMWLSSSLFLERRCNHRSSAVINHSNTFAFASSSTWTVIKAAVVKNLLELM